MNKTICVEKLIQEPDHTCYANISGEGMVITWGKWIPNNPMEGLFIKIPREKMLELADAINKVSK